MSFRRQLMLALLLLVGCTSDATDDVPTATTGVITTTVARTSATVATTTTTTVNENLALNTELRVFMERIGELVQRWNATQLNWVSAYSDDSVSWEEFLQIQHETELAQGRLLAEYTLWASSLPEELGEAVGPVLDNYRQRFDVLRNEVFPSVVQGDDESFQEGGAKYTELTSPGVLRPLLIEVFSTPILESHLRLEGVTPTQLADAIVGVAGE